ncbi:AMP-binding protein [Commensalibacter communis]|uniref:AMP-binding protein n=1 Tax=Commensalibacter communis TaxID=2972786 RepID=UPI0022FF4EE8|nr:class I adenylate-forming enzyme family protein [Commensalibacter communis]CAI3958175.1 O-succinylbenzoic acid-CoA ligase MenE or related acyl-CoA synthetase (AMP-forming) (MenE/FadK) (PDB:5EY9) (PUBMED:25151136 [Commensalibacter communis]CAI3958252.1 O-succinylbenzoic acid-CoA ligase MenE or related acyl-CoA synthetase (AMP-forming) (MenE/FadK) (PDB:5EY9) (PUBMED:25151136 [Commensalibacter communis]
MVEIFSMYDRFIEHVARIAPGKEAMLSFDGSVTFAKMDADINRLATALLQKLNPLPKVVAVSYQQMHPHWMFLMALSRIGVATASVGDDSLIAAREIAVLKPDLIISDAFFDVETEAKVLVLDLEWYSQIVDGVDVEPLRFALPRDRVVRVAIAAGTSEKKHRVDFTAPMIEAAVIRHAHQEYIEWEGAEDAAQYHRLLPTLGTGSIHGFLSVLSIWYVCGSVIMADREQYPAAIAMLKPSIMIISPSQLEDILSHMPADVPSVTGLRLVVSAGYFASALQETVRRKLTQHMRVLYVTSEAGLIAGARVEQMTHDDMAGWLLPSVDLQIVDDEDNELPAGEIGNIRVKSAELVNGFYEDEEATNRQFKDGWFYPGDLGILDIRGGLRIFGRADELYNFGGDKFYAHTIDRIVQSLPGVKDAALFAMPNEQGVPEPWLAIVKDVDFNVEKVSEALESEFHNLPNVRAMWVDTIPRDVTDRVLRYQLSMAATQQYAKMQK